MDNIVAFQTSAHESVCHKINNSHRNLHAIRACHCNSCAFLPSSIGTHDMRDSVCVQPTHLPFCIDLIDVFITVNVYPVHFIPLKLAKKKPVSCYTNSIAQKQASVKSFQK